MGTGRVRRDDLVVAEGRSAGFGIGPVGGRHPAVKGSYDAGMGTIVDGETDYLGFAEPLRELQQIADGGAAEAVD